MGDAALQDSIVADGLTDAFHNCHMGITGIFDQRLHFPSTDIIFLYFGVMVDRWFTLCSGERG